MLPLCCWVDFHVGRHVPVAESSKTHRALDDAPLSKVAVCWAQCLVPDLTSLCVWNIQEWWVWHSYVGAGMMAFHPVSFMSFPSQISYFIQMIFHLTFIPAVQRGTAVKTKTVTHTHSHAGTHAHTHTHTHTLTHMQVHMQAHPHA
jgi:hypothetical protein